MLDPLMWSILCCFLVAVAVAMEMLTPSFGLLTCTAIGLVVMSVWLGFKSSPSAGFAMIGANLAVFPLAVFLGMYFMRHSPLMNRQQIVRQRPGAAAEAEAPAPVHEWVGREARVLTALRPAGTVELDEERITVVSEGKFVDVGATVRIVRVEGNVVTVEPLA